MSVFLSIHKDNPQARLLRQAVTIIQEGGLVVYPTDSGYALGCQLGNKEALTRIRQIRQLDKTHLMTLICRDLSDLGTYAKVNNTVFRLLKAHTPGPYTFLLNATSEVPRRMLHPNRRVIGMRVPDHPITQALLEAMDAPLMSTTLTLPGETIPLSEPEAIRDILGKRVDLIIDGGCCSLVATSVIDLTDSLPVVVREGKGDVTPFR